MLEINDFDLRLKQVNEILAKELSRITELKNQTKKADTIMAMDKEQRREAIRNIFKRKNGSSPGGDEE